ncbi:SusD/RagB family nutrient-binding outer membrane lipoprotein [Fulvivirga sediminis]|uniref:SusD/RagB family nutrient-binding outer membrane lipoprotein n=1 Tax=Fulvivirga sediminis TaxID=2803949 RepID=A0A937JXX1_9BACT|nr:SusD/RagB family nutrient-binding outer membrane lipoprotein [Fulvivirga sediminis]MBL3655883.1 SusD/RagB family nutrient-binding outer membrane lipoprotein [Fulvivirga sediminis]
MKLKKLYYILSFVLVLCISCTDDFDEMNQDPNTLTEEQIDATMAGPAFANVLYKGIHQGSNTGVYDDQGTYGLITMLQSMTFVHYLSTTSSTFATERNGINDGWVNRGWLRFYTQALPSLNIAYESAEGNAEAIAVLDIWKVFIFHQMTDEWGPVPYSEAGNGKSSVAYDSQQKMYDDFFNLLASAEKTLSSTSESTVGIFASYDRIYDGDIAKWRKFGNSLRLRLALRISDVDPAKAKVEAEAAINAGVMQSNGDAAFFKVSQYTDNNFVKIAPAWGFVMTSSMESLLKGYNDPRMEIWFAPSLKETYTGQPNGRGVTRAWNDSTLSFVNNATFGDQLFATKPIEVMLTSETYFNLAEAALNGWNVTNTAQNYYEQGISLSLEQWQVKDQTTIDNYITGSSVPVKPDLVDAYAQNGLDTNPPVKVAVSWAASEQDQRTQIAVQKYLALFPESWETWADLRRTDANILYPLLNTDNPDVGRGLMKRLTYLDSETTSNAEEVKAAINLLGGPDNGATRVWWDVK